MNRKSLTQSVEDFVRAIYGLQEGDSWVATTALAARLGQRPASVTNMIQRLSRVEGCLVEYVPYQGVRLNAPGMKVALEIVRHHRLIESYLAQALGVPWDQVHAEAERLEHVLSEDVEDRMAAALSDPRTDPHGSPIPSKDGHVEHVATTPLTTALPGATVRIVEVDDRDAALLRYLGDLGLYPGTEFTLLGQEPYGRSLQVRCGEREFNIGEEALPHIRVAAS
jgi:DtxR family Mn-dependent transcriptional regulator